MSKALRTSLLVLCCFANYSVFCNDYFEKTLAQIDSNIDNQDYVANFTYIKEIEPTHQFQQLDCYQKGQIYHKIGLSHYYAYQEAKAIDYFDNKVLTLWETCGKVPLEEKANTMYNLGICHQYLGNMEKAKVFLDQSLGIFENVEDYPGYQLGLKYHGMGLFYESLDDLFRAQLYFTNAIAIFEKERAILEQFEVLNSAVTLHLEFKEYEQATEYVEEALTLSKEHSDLIPSKDVIPVLLNAATIAFEEKDHERAENLAKSALDIMDDATSPEFRIIGLEILAFLKMENNDFEQAETIMQNVLFLGKQFNQEGSGHNLLARIHENLASLFLQKGNLNKANDQLAKGLRIVAPNTTLDSRMVPTVSNTEIKNENTLIRLMEIKTRIFERQYGDTGNLEWLQHSLEVQQKIDSVIKKGLFSLQFEQSKLDFLDVRFKYYGKAIKDALRLYDLTQDWYYLEQAHQFSAKTKALTLQQELNRINALRNMASNAILEEENMLRETMNEQRSLLFEASEGKRDSLLQSFLQAQNTLDVFLTQLEKKEPDYYRERYGFLNVPTIRAIQRTLPDDVAVIEFFEAEESIYAFWISRYQFFNTTVAFTEKLKKSIERFTEQCATPELPVSQTDSHFIFGELVKEGLYRLTNVNRLAIIPDGLLHTLSFEALHNGEGYLIEDYAFTYAYAASLLRAKNNDQTKTSRDYIGFAASYSDGLSAKLKAQKRFFGDEALSPLALSTKEVEQASVIFGGNTFLGDGASLENFHSHANDARILHLSLHGLVDTDDPSRSCIIFDDSGKDFLLSPPDLYKNRLQADLVLLSACHSANGKIYNGEGVQGMSKAFLLAGAQNVFSSLWNASETSSLDITQSFLEQTQQNVPFDMALQKAKLDYLKKVTPSQRHPYYWANFILLGKAEPATVASNGLLFMIIGVMLAAVFFVFLYLRHRQRS